MLTVQFCFLVLITWRLALGDGRYEAASDLGAGKSTADRSVSVRQRDADIDAKLQVLEMVIRQGSNAPEGVLRSLAEQTAQVNELRSSLRGQQSLARELDGKVRELENSLADAQRREKRQQTEAVELQNRLTTLVSRLEESRAQLEAAKPNSSTAASADEASWWSSLWANSKPISFGAVLGAVIIGAVLVVVQRTKRPNFDSPNDQPMGHPRDA